MTAGSSPSLLSKSSAAASHCFGTDCQEKAVGGTATFNVAVNSQNGYSDQFQFSCPNVPTGISCVFQPASGTLNANGTLASSLNVTVTSRPAAFAAPDHGRRFSSFQRTLINLASLLVGLLLLAWRTARASGLVWNYAAGTIVAAVAVLIVASIASCGGGSSTTEPPPPPPSPVTVSFNVQATSPVVTINAGTITITVN